MCPYPWSMNGFGCVQEGSPGAGEHDHTERRHLLDSADKKTLPPDECDTAPLPSLKITQGVIKLVHYAI